MPFKFFTIQQVYKWFFMQIAKLNKVFCTVHVRHSSTVFLQIGGQIGCGFIPAHIFLLMGIDFFAFLSINNI